MAVGRQSKAAARRARHRRGRRSGRPPRSLRLGLEPLEDRRLLAVGAIGELRLTAADAAAGDLFGSSVAIDGDFLVVGSPGDDGSPGDADAFETAGSAYVYRFDGNIWLLHEKLLASDPVAGDGFGGAVAISGETIVVGAAGHDHEAEVDAGAAYVFVLSGDSWLLQDELLPRNGAAGDAFGSSVTIEGDVVAIGAAGASAALPDVGAAFVFQRTDRVWSQQDKLLADDARTGDEFGASIDLSGDRIVVGAPAADEAGESSGSAYVFGRNDADWTLQSRLNSAGATAGDGFGGAVAIGGMTIVVGAAGSDASGDDAGAAYVFVEQAGDWIEQATLTSPDAADGDLFGSAVDVAGDLVLVGAAHNKDAVDGAGAAYLFGAGGAEWSLLAKLTSDDAATDDRFGSALALDDDRLVVGASGSDMTVDDDSAEADAGAAYAYALNRFDAPLFFGQSSAGDVMSDRINEASGLVASRQNPGVLWTHNDSGDANRIYAMNSQGEDLGVFTIGKITHRDWEDIAIGPGPAPGVNYLYIGDFGNNAAHFGGPRSNIVIYRVAEPLVDPSGGDQSATLGEVDTLTLTYPDEAWDNETLLVDPWTGDLVLVTKRAEFNHVYRLPAPGPGDLTAELQYVGNMMWGDQPPAAGSNSGIVAGDVSPTGREIILKNYTEVGLFSRPVGTGLAEVLVGVVPALLPYEKEPKGEGLSFDAAGEGYFTLSEGRDPPLNYYGRDPSSRVPTVVQLQQGVFPTPEYDAAQDAPLQQNAAEVNFGSADLLTVSGGPAGEVVVSVLQWSDLASVPVSSLIEAVSLTFEVTDATRGAGYQLFEVRRDWTQSKVSFDRATKDDLWQTPGAAGATDRGTTLLGTVRPTATGRFTMTLNQAGVDVVQSWLSDPSSNRGFLLVSSTNEDAPNEDTLSLASNEAIAPRLRPKLTIGFLRPDEVAPVATLDSPLDNGPLDRDPTDGQLLLNRTTEFEFQLTDREIDDSSVTSASVVVTRDDRPLIDGVDYVFDYDAQVDRIRLTPITSKFDVGRYRITLSPEDETIVDAAGNKLPASEFVVVLDDKFPTPLAETGPLGSLIYGRTTIGSILAENETQRFFIDLDAGQTLAVVVSPETSLRPTIRVAGPAGEVIGSPVEAAVNGARIVSQAAPIRDAGIYEITVGETGATTGGFSLQALLNASFEEEEFLRSPNDDVAHAEDLDASFIDLSGDLDGADGRQRAVVLGTANALLRETLLEAHFNDNDQGFTYLDDAFNDTDNPNRAIGSYEASGGFEGGGLQVVLPGGSFLGPPTRAASGAWVRSFDLAEDASVDVALRYRLVLAQRVDGDEFGEVILEIDGVRLGTDENESLIHTDGDDEKDDSGWLLAQFTVDLSAGRHELRIGVYNNRSNRNNETVQAQFDDVSVSVSARSAEHDVYRFSLNAGDSASIVLASLSAAEDAPLSIVNAAGELLARGVATPGGQGYAIVDFVAPVTDTYYVRVTSRQEFSAPYTLVVTRNATFNPGPAGSFMGVQDVSVAGAVLGALTRGNPLGVFYSVSVSEGDVLTISTSTPGGGPFQPENNLDPTIELYSPLGKLVGSDENGNVDGRNARLTHVATVDGQYHVRLTGAGGTSGGFLLEIDGATGPLAPLVVTSSDPPAGARRQDSPAQITVRFSHPIFRPETIEASVLSVGGVGATGVTLVDGRTLRFDLPPLAEATHQVVIDAGRISDVRGQPNQAYRAELTIDRTAPRITAASIDEGATLAAGNLSLDVTFDDRLNRRGLQSIGRVLFGMLSGRNFAPEKIIVTSEGNISTLRLEFVDLPEDLYTLTLASGDGVIEDLAGNDLDGEPGTFPTGNGQPGGDFLLHFSLDADRVELKPFTRLRPLGSLAFASMANRGLINTTADGDEHTFFARAGETVTASVRPDDPSAILTVEWVGEAAGAIAAPGPGEPAVLPSAVVSAGGIATLRIGGDTAGVGYTLDVLRNVVVEFEDTSTANTLNIDPSLLDVGLKRWAVLGTSDAALPATVFSTTGSTWKFFDKNLDLGTAWKEFDFDDEKWEKGPSILGAGVLSDGDDVLSIATTVDRGPNGERFITTYFRREFDVADPSIYEHVLLELLRDDGAAVYLNGEEVARSNLANDATFSTVASDRATDETAYFPFDVDPAKLRAGRNVLAVEVHQVSPSSSDLGMDVILSGIPKLEDSYTLDLTGMTGRTIDVLLAGQNGADFSNEVLEILDVDGRTVLARGAADPLGVAATNYDLAILGFVVPADGLYAFRLSSRASTGQYALVVTANGVFESEPNDQPGDVKRTLAAGDRAIGFVADAGMDSFDVDSFDVLIRAGQTLVAVARPLSEDAQGTPLNTLDLRLRLLDESQVEQADDDDSLDGRAALLSFRAETDGTYTIFVESAAGQGEYLLELLNTEAVRVVARHVFYNNSRFDGFDEAINPADDAAIAPDKRPLLPGESANSANYTTFVKGINGLMIDVQGLLGAGNIDASNIDAGQFIFRMGNTDVPATWPLAPQPNRVTVRKGAGLNGSDRVVVTWPDGAITNTWLQVTLRATPQSGLAQADVFYVGSAVGDTGLGNQPTVVLVDQVDREATRNQRRNFLNPAPIDFPFDFNRDGLVDGVDRAIVRENQTGEADGLVLLVRPDGAASPVAKLLFAVALDDIASAGQIASAQIATADSALPTEPPRRTERRSARRTRSVQSVFEDLGSSPPLARGCLAKGGRLRIATPRHQRPVSAVARRLALATDMALEALTHEVFSESGLLGV